jgi:phosphoglycolate phosphatase-like HAD superfamily hydrolase
MTARKPPLAATLSDEVEEREGADIRAAESALYLTFIEEVEPLRGARALMEDLRDRGRQVVLASSAKAAGIESLAVLTGGFSEEELLEAGASAVFDSIDALLGLDETPLG